MQDQVLALLHRRPRGAGENELVMRYGEQVLGVLAELQEQDRAAMRGL